MGSRQWLAAARHSLGLALVLVFVFLVMEAMNQAAKPRHEIPKADNPAWAMKDERRGLERRIAERGRFAVTRPDRRRRHPPSVDDVWLSFGGVKAIQGVSFDVREHEIRAIIGPNGAGKSSMLNVINGVYQPQQGRITFRGKVRTSMDPHDAAPQGFGRTFQSLALFKGMSVLDNIMTGRNPAHAHRAAGAGRAPGLRAARGTAAPRVRRAHHRLSRDPGLPQDTGRATAVRAAEAR